METWNIAVQQALPKHFALDVAYGGLHGVDTAARYNLNGSTTTPGYGNLRTAAEHFVRQNAGATPFWDGFSSSYNALQVKLDRHFRDFVMTTAFTGGTGMDYWGGDDGGLTWLIDAQRNYARTAPHPGCWETGSFRESSRS